MLPFFAHYTDLNCVSLSFIELRTVCGIQTHVYYFMKMWYCYRLVTKEIWRIN